MTLSFERDGHQIIYTIFADKLGKPQTKSKHRPFEKLEAWWSKTGRGDTFLIKQENDKQRADVLELSFGQVYDLLAALNHAIGLPIGGRRAVERPE